MSKEICPLFMASKEKKSSLFLIKNERKYTYLDLEKQTQFLTSFLSKYPKQSVFSSLCEDFFFSASLLFACLRLGHIFFPLSSKLPEKTLQEYQEKAGVLYHFSEPVYGEHFSKIKGEIEPSLPLTYILTSGSSSTPQICVHSFSNHAINAQTSNEHLNFTRGKSWLCSLPLYHVSGLSLIFRSVLAKATLIQKSDKIEKTLKNEKITHISLVPTQLKRLINQKSLLSLDCILLGGAPIYKELLKEADQRHLPLFPTYGLTEMSSQVFTYCAKEKKMIPLPQREFMIDQNQELYLKGPTLFLGYLQEGSLSLPLTPNGWYATKDLANIENGNFVFLGRKDHLFISGGENIQPEEIERILLSHPEIEEAIVLPIPDEEFGHRPIAFIKALSLISQASLELFIKPLLPKYKHPLEYHPLKYSGLKPSRKGLLTKFINKMKHKKI